MTLEKPVMIQSQPPVKSSHAIEHLKRVLARRSPSDEVADVLLLEATNGGWQWTCAHVGMEDEFTHGGPFPDIGAAHEDGLAQWNKRGGEFPPVIEINYTADQCIGVANAFVTGLHRVIGKDDLPQVIHLNMLETNPSICHSRDFCDANKVMADAQAQVLGFASDPRSKSQLKLWDDSWKVAKTLMPHFFIAHFYETMSLNRPADR